MKKLLVLGILAAGANSCSGLRVDPIANKKVKIVDPTELTVVKSKCQFVAEIQNCLDESGMGLIDGCASVGQMKSKAVTLQANVVVSSLMRSEYTGVKGQAYFCVPEVFGALTNAENL
jgi:hypothetical protein